ncbi:MAG TPA: hypothetical protein VHV51_00810, partial [Polyangiaceae bacterium]|nr:hypothetical protein [Polyangiaceae bacterium]
MSRAASTRVCILRGFSRFFWVLAAELACGCGHHGTNTTSPNPSAGEPVLATPTTSGPSLDRLDRFDLIPNLSWCEVDHDGLLLDLGTAAAAAYRDFGAERSDSSEDTERDGQTFVRAYGRSLRYDFWLDDPRSGTTVSLRVYGGAAKWLGVAIDDKRVGSLKLVPGETKVLSLPPLGAELARGHHRLKLSFSGAPRGQREAQGEIDWVRIAERNAEASAYAAPTLGDIVADVVLNGAPKRALVVRAPSTVRCWLRPAPDARLKVALGFWGAGKGAAEVRVVADGEEPVTLQTHRVTGGDGASWTPLAVDLAPFAGKVIGIEFRAIEGSREGRVAFGDPSIARKPLAEIAVPRAKTAILLLESSIDRRQVPPFGPAGKLSTLADFARVATAFSGYRAPSVVVQATVTSLLTGLSPPEHRVEDPSSRIADSVRLLSELVKEASGRTAMFSGVPTTFDPFGFNAGWDTF